MSRFIPRGVEVAGIGRRFLAAVIDALPVALVVGGMYAVMAFSESPTVVLVSSIAAAVLAGGYGLFQWWGYGSRGAGIGARAMGLKLVGMGDGEPIGWWRFFLRQVIFAALFATVIGGIALVVFLVIHERRQGWHDMAVKAVLVQPKETEKVERRNAARKGSTTSTVGLPPHLSSAFAPGSTGGDEGRQNWGGYSPEGSSAPPAWMPQLETEPIISVNRQSGTSMPPTQPPPGQYQQPAPQPSAPPMGGQQPQQQWGQQNQQNQQPPGGQWGPSAPQPPSPQQPSPQPPQPPSTQPPPAPQQQPSAPQPPQQPSAPPNPGAQGPGQQPGQGPVQQPPVPPHQATPPARVNQGWIPLPTPTSVIEPPRQTGSSEAPRVRQRDFGGVDDDDDDGTRIAKPVGADDGARPGDEGWYVRLDDGREVELGVTVLLGRNPQRTQGDPDVHLVPAGGDGRMISRTHVLIATDPRGVFVVDRGSTNGTALVTGDGDLEPCPVGTQVRVRDGQQVSYGNRWFTVLRRPPQS